MKEFFGTVTYYGIGHIFRSYCGFNDVLPFPASIQHGWSIVPNMGDAVAGAPQNFYWTEEIRRQYAESYPSINTLAVGAPFLYLLEVLNYEELPSDKREGSIVFPSHSFAMCDVECDFNAYAEMLAELPEEYKPITVCLYHLDQRKGLGKAFSEKGFTVVCNGQSLYEKSFLQNFVANTRTKKYAFSNQMTSALLFATEMGLTSFFWGPEYTTRNEDPVDAHHDYNKFMRTWETKYGQHFRFPDCDGLQQRKFADHELGKDRMLAPDEMRSLLRRLVLHPLYREMFVRRCSERLQPVIPAPLIRVTKRLANWLRVQGFSNK